MHTWRNLHLEFSHFRKQQIFMKNLPVKWKCPLFLILSMRDWKLDGKRPTKLGYKELPKAFFCPFLAFGKRPDETRHLNNFFREIIGAKSLFRLLYLEISIVQRLEISR